MKNTDIRTLCLIALVFILAGCGVDWFPQFVRAPTTPDQFSFTSKFGVPIFAQISSNSVKITGFANSSTASPISISTGSKYSINGAAAVDTAGTIKNNETVKVIQTSANAPGTTTVSTLTIGNINGTFTTSTQTIVTPNFVKSPTQSFAGFTEISALISGTDIGGHTVTMTGFDNTQFAISDANNLITTNFNTSTAPLSVSFLNGQHILLLIPIVGASATTTLTIDSTNFVINNSTFAVASSPK